MISEYWIELRRADLPTGGFQLLVPPLHRPDANMRGVFVFEVAFFAGQLLFGIQYTEQQSTGNYDAMKFHEDVWHQLRLPMFSDL